MRQLFIALALISGSTFASGWTCSGELHDTGIGPVRIKLVNKTGATRSPAILLMSNLAHGTLLSAKGSEIEKTITRRATEYTASVKAGDKLLTEYGMESINFGVFYREGVNEPLKNGQSVKGYINVQTDDHNEYADLLCKRYLKSNE